MALSGNLAVALAGPFSGALVDRKGYNYPLIIGAAGLLLGYVGLRAQYVLLRSNLMYSCLCLFIVGSGLTFLFSVCLKCSAVTFPQHRGMATSLPSALYGLLAMFYSVAASSIYPGDTLGFLYFLPFSVVVIFIACAPIIMTCETRRTPAPRVVLALEPLEMASLPAFGKANKFASSLRVANTGGVGVGGGHLTGHYDAGEVSDQSLLLSPRFWLLFVITGSIASIGQMYIYSVGYMVKALILVQLDDASDSSIETAINTFIQGEQSLQVALLSTANCLGRLVAGFLGDFVRHNLRKPRSWLLFIPGFGFTLTQFMALSILDYHGLHAVSSISGFMYGFTFCMLPIIVGDVFGMNNFSRNWGLMGLAPIIPSNLFTSLFGIVYDLNSIVTELGLHLCLAGNQCYNLIFNLSLVVALVALFIVFIFNFGDAYLSTRTILGRRLGSFN